MAAAGPSGFLGYLRSLGPGIVVAMAWLGSGDLVDSAVAGSTGRIMFGCFPWRFEGGEAAFCRAVAFRD